MFQLEIWHQKIVRQILSKYPYKFYAYGSRAKGTARKFSDLDLCYQDNFLTDAEVFLDRGHPWGFGFSDWRGV